jgi:hypothetical protein
MCLTSDKIKTKKHSLITINKKMRFWKEFEVTEEKGTLLTSFTSTTVKRTLNYIEPTVSIPSVSNSCSVFFKMETIIEGGCIHAYIKYKKSKRYGYIIVPIIVESDDIIAFGKNNDVCFFKYKISNHAWERIEKLRPSIIERFDIYGNQKNV